MTHIIRLRGPWLYQPLARTVLLSDGSTEIEPGDLPPSGRVRLPCDWGDSLGQDFRGQVRFTRHFHRPTGLDQGQAVLLAVEQVDAWARIILNDHFLGELRAVASPGRFDVTNHLRERNELTVDVELPRVSAESTPLSRAVGREGKPGGLVGEVRLEIE